MSLNAGTVRPGTTGLVVGALAAGAAMQPTVLPRSSPDQMVLAAGAAVAGTAAGAIIDGGARVAARTVGASPTVVRAGVLTASGLAVAATELRNDRPGFDGGLAQSLGLVTAATAGAGLVSDAVAGFADRAAPPGSGLARGLRVARPALVLAGLTAAGSALALSRPRTELLPLAKDQPSVRRVETKPTPPPVSVAAVGFGAGAALGVVGLLRGERLLVARVAGSTPARVALHAAAAVVGGGVAIAATRVGVPTPTTPDPDAPLKVASVTGGPASTLDAETLGPYGGTFVRGAIPGSVIERVTGEAAIDPVRAYVSLEAGATTSARVDAAMRELEALGAFDRRFIMITTPTGRGSVDVHPVAAAEAMARGDIATVALQYEDTTSQLSIFTRGRGRDDFAELARRIRERIDSMPAGARRPVVVASGYSLGSWVQQEVAAQHGPGGDAVAGLRRLGVDRALWVGTPHRSEWMQQVAGPERDRAIAERHVAAGDDGEDFQRLDDDAVDAARVVVLDNRDDPMVLTDFDQLVEPSRRGAGPGADWLPFITFMQGVSDMGTAGRLRSMPVGDMAHNYRDDSAAAMRVALGLSRDEVTPAHEARIAEWFTANAPHETPPPWADAAVEGR